MATNRIFPGRAGSVCRQNWKASLRAASTAVEPSSEKKTRSRPGGATPASRRANSTVVGLERPRFVVWATFPACSASAASSRGWRWPWTLHHMLAEPSR